MTVLHDPHLIARVAMGQLSDVSGSTNRMITHLFLHEPFALGYAIGFAEQACRYAKDENEDVNGSAYVLAAIGQMLGDDAAAASFVAFAVSKQGDRTFEGGYDAGLGDMDTWCSSGEEYVPRGLMRYLDGDKRYGWIQRRGPN